MAERSASAEFIHRPRPRSGLDSPPVVIGGIHGGYFQPNLFARLASRLAPHHIDRGPALSPPTAMRNQDGIRPQPVSIARQIRKNRLRNFLGKLGRTDLTQCGAINQIEMPLNERGESVLRLIADEFIRAESKSFIESIITCISPQKVKTGKDSLKSSNIEPFLDALMQVAGSDNYHIPSGHKIPPKLLFCRYLSNSPFARPKLDYHILRNPRNTFPIWISPPSTAAVVSLPLP